MTPNAWSAGSCDTRANKRTRTEHAPRSLADYIDCMHEPVYDGADMTMLQMCFLFCDIKVSDKVNNEAFNKTCRALHDCCLPKPNIFPPSWHLVRGLMQSAQASEFEGHMCNKCSKVLPRLERAQWLAHAADTCDCCGHRRFKVLLNGVTPYKRFWDFKIDNCVREWMADKEFALNRGKNDEGTYHDLSDEATFLGSPRGKQLDASCGKVFSEKKHASYYSLGAMRS